MEMVQEGILILVFTLVFVKVHLMICYNGLLKVSLKSLQKLMMKYIGNVSLIQLNYRMMTLNNVFKNQQLREMVVMDIGDS